MPTEEESANARIDVQPTIVSIQRWITRQINISGTNGVVVGISGGIDSAVVAALCARAGLRVHGMLVKCQNSSRDVSDARDVANNVGIELEEVDIVGAYTEMCRRISIFSNSGLTKANMKSRLRMTALYARANTTGCLVCGTTNLTELMLGYYTKYGDGGVDIEPIAGLLKREVRAVGVALGIPPHIVAKSPSAGLWEGQSDEDEIGYDYATMDNVALAMANGGRSAYVGNHVTYDTLESRHIQTNHKRQPIPHGIGCVVLRREQ